MKFLLAPLVAWAIAQAAKVILTSVRQHRLNLRVLAETGGMPSSHAAIVMGLTTPVDVPALSDYIAARDVGLLVLDPLTSVMDGRIERIGPPSCRLAHLNNPCVLA